MVSKDFPYKGGRIMSMLNCTVASLITTSLLPPTANDDSAGTGGNGRFSPGNRWLATTMQAEYLCMSSAVGAAVWARSAGVQGATPERYYLRYVETSGTSGGAATAVAPPGTPTWFTRPLNDIVSVGGAGASLNVGTSEFTLTAGTYDIRVDATFYRTRGSSVRLFNVTGNNTEAVSTSVWTQGNASSNVVINVPLAPVATTVYRLDYICTQSNPNGLGRAAGNGIEEVYTLVKVEKYV